MSGGVLCGYTEDTPGWRQLGEKVSESRGSTVWTTLRAWSVTTG